MEYLVTGREMAEYDRVTSEHFQIPSVVLMEQAAQAFVVRLLEICGERMPESVLVVCGSGNNGGDGIAIARLLNLRGIRTTIFVPVDDGGHESELRRLQREIYEKYGFPQLSELHTDTYDVIIDAVFGTGLSREVTGVWAERLAVMNAMPGRKVAVDIASGVSADTGAVLGMAFQADETITFSFGKVGQFLFPGAGVSGRISVVPIGITKDCFAVAGTPQVRMLNGADLSLLPARQANSHKGIYGKLLVIAGSHGMAGAAVFAARAACHMGTGLVKVLTPESNRVILQTMVPEAILSIYPDEVEDKLLEIEMCHPHLRAYADMDPVRMEYAKEAESTVAGENIGFTGKGETTAELDSILDHLHEMEKPQELLEQLQTDLAWADAVVIGPGLGTGAVAEMLVGEVLAQAQVPVLADADALNLISEKMELLQHRKVAQDSVSEDANTQNILTNDSFMLQSKNHALDETTNDGDKDASTGMQDERYHDSEGKRIKYRIPLIITPHVGEMSRLTGKSAQEIKADPIGIAVDFAKQYQAICVLKDARSVIATPDGEVFINCSGNNGMATAGSGDVLSGIIGGLLAQGMEPGLAAPLGAFFHGRAGDAARERNGVRYMTASNIIDSMSEVCN